MNNYKIMADSYKKLCEKGKITKEVADKEIRVLDFLSECEEDDLFRLVDTGAFNDIIRGYAELFLNDINLSDEDRKKINYRIVYEVFDTYNAEQALNKWKNN